MKNRIVVATDFSENSKLAISKAIYLAKTLKAGLDVAHIVEYSIFRDSKKEKKAGKMALKKFIAENFPSCEVEMQLFCYVGAIHKELSKHAHTRDCRFVCIGSKGEHYSAAELVLGSIAKQIVRKCEVPVLVAKSDNLADYQNIFAPTDFSEHSLKFSKITRKIFNDVKFIFYNMIARPFELRLGHYGANIEQINNYNKNAEEKAKSHSKKFLRQFDPSLRQSEVVLDSGILSHTRLISVAESKNAHLIALPTNGKISFFALDVLENSPIDIFIMKF